MTKRDSQGPVRVVLRLDSSDSDTDECQKSKSRSYARITRKLFSRASPKQGGRRSPRQLESSLKRMVDSGSYNGNESYRYANRDFVHEQAKRLDGNNIEGGYDEGGVWEEETESAGLGGTDSSLPNTLRNAIGYHHRYSHHSGLIERSPNTGYHRDEITGNISGAHMTNSPSIHSQQSGLRFSTGSETGAGSPSISTKTNRTGLLQMRSTQRGHQFLQPQQITRQGLLPKSEREAVGQAFAQMRTEEASNKNEELGFEPQLGSGLEDMADLIIGDTMNLHPTSMRLQEADESERVVHNDRNANKSHRKSTMLTTLSRQKASHWAMVRAAFSAVPWPTSAGRSSAITLTDETLKSCDENDELDLDRYSSNQGSAGHTKRETLPRVRLALDEGAWVARQFNSCLIRWRKVKEKRLNPMQREVSRVVQNIQTKTVGDSMENTMPVDIQLVHIGATGTPTTEFHAPEHIATSPLEIQNRRSVLNQESLSGKQIYFHLLSTSAREYGDNTQNSVFCKIVITNKQWRTQTKMNSSFVAWGETFLIDVNQLSAANWCIVVQLWSTPSSQFLGEAEINFKTHAEDMLLLAHDAPVCIHSVQMTAENAAGRQYTGKVQYAMWLRHMKWWGHDISEIPAHAKEAPLRNDKMPRGVKKQKMDMDFDWMPGTSFWLPKGIPRPMPSIVHLQDGTLYEDPLVTFLYLKIVKIRATDSSSATPKARADASQAQSFRQRKRTAITAHSQKAMISAHRNAQLQEGDDAIRDPVVGSHSNGIADAMTSLDLTDMDQDDAAAMEKEHIIASDIVDYELKVSCRGIRKVFAFRGPRELREFATVNASMVFPISNCLCGSEYIRVYIRRGRRLVVDTQISLQSLFDSIARLSNTHEEGILWNLPGLWPGQSANGEVILCYGAANSDHRGGLAKSEQPKAQAMNTEVPCASSRGFPPAQLPTIYSEAADLQKSMNYVHMGSSVGLKSAPELLGPISPMGYIKVILNKLILEETVSCFCIIRCSNYWIKTSTIVLQPVWRDLGFVIPMWRLDDHLTLGVFKANPISIRSTTPLVGKLRFRISSIKPGKQLSAQFPLELDGTSKGTASMTVAWTYSQLGMLLRSYIKPRQPDNLWYLGIHQIVKDMDKEVLNISMKWLDMHAHPQISAAVSRKTLSTTRDEFRIETAKKHWSRIMGTIRSIKGAAASFNELASWNEPSHSIAAIAGSFVFIWYPHIMLSLASVAVAMSSLREGSSFSRNTSVQAASSGSSCREVSNKAKEVEVPATGVIDRYNKMIDFGLMIQNILDDIASGAEQFQALTNWKDPTTTLVVCNILLIAAPIFYVAGLRMLLCFGAFWAMRPPVLRTPITPPPIVFFTQLPTKFHSLLAIDMDASDTGSCPETSAATLAPKEAQTH